AAVRSPQPAGPKRREPMTFAGMLAPVVVTVVAALGPSCAPGGREGPDQKREPVPRPAPSSDNKPTADNTAPKKVARRIREWLPKPLPGPETRSPDDFELCLESSLEAPRGPGAAASSGRYVPASRIGPTTSLCAGTGGCASGTCNQGQRIPYAPVLVNPT